MIEKKHKELYNELSDLKDEFDRKWGNNIHNLRYQTKVKENDNRVAEIINSFVRIMKKYDFLYQIILENQEVNYEVNKTYMETTGLWNKKEFSNYSLKVILKLRELLDDE